MTRQTIPFDVMEARKSQAIGRIVAMLPSFPVDYLDGIAESLAEQLPGQPPLALHLVPTNEDAHEGRVVRARRRIAILPLHRQRARA